MSNQKSVVAALAILQNSDLRKVLNCYRVSQPDESNVMPASVFVSHDDLRALKVLFDLGDAFQKGFRFFAVSQWGYGMNTEPHEAFLSCKGQTPSGKKTGQIEYFLCHPETIMNGLGNWSYPEGFPPRKLSRPSSSVSARPDKDHQQKERPA
jgi:hypothetical protein